MKFLQKLFHKIKIKCNCCCKSNCDIEVDNEDK